MPPGTASMSAVMNVRRKRPSRLALAVVAALAVPALSACGLQGFDYATNRPNVIANGGSNLDGNIHVLAARIISPSAGQGTFVASISTEPNATGPVRLVDISGVTATNFKPIEIGPSDLVNLYTAGGLNVRGDFSAGHVVPVVLTFDDGTKVDVNSIVVTQCHDYASPATSPAKDGDGASDDVASDSDAEAYDCDFPTLPAVGH